jgi:hypothetical protein
MDLDLAREVVNLDQQDSIRLTRSSSTESLQMDRGRKSNMLKFVDKGGSFSRSLVSWG